MLIQNLKLNRKRNLSNHILHGPEIFSDFNHDQFPDTQHAHFATAVVLSIAKSESALDFKDLLNCFQLHLKEMGEHG